MGPKIGGQDGLELTSQNRLGKKPLIWNDIQHVAQKSSNDTDLNQQISGEIFLGPKDKALSTMECTRKGVPGVLWQAQRCTRSAMGVDSIVERILTEADVTTVLDRQSCALGTVTICNKSPHSGWPMENIPPEHQTTTTSLISQSRCTLKPLMQRQREVLNKPGSVTPNRGGSRDDTSWVPSKTSTSSRETCSLARTQQKTHGIELGPTVTRTIDQTQGFFWGNNVDLDKSRHPRH